MFLNYQVTQGMPEEFYGLDAPHPISGRLLGFDFGLRRIGIATGQGITNTATPQTVILARDGEPDWNDIQQLIVKWRPEAIVVGIPLDMYDQETSITIAAKKFAQALKQRTQLPVFGINERLSSEAAKERLMESGGMRKVPKQGLDAISAQIILEDWLNEYN